MHHLRLCFLSLFLCSIPLWRDQTKCCGRTGAVLGGFFLAGALTVRVCMYVHSTSSSKKQLIIILLFKGLKYILLPASDL